MKVEIHSFGSALFNQERTQIQGYPQVFNTFKKKTNLYPTFLVGSIINCGYYVKNKKIVLHYLLNFLYVRQEKNETMSLRVKLVLLERVGEVDCGICTCKGVSEV